jgi:SpoVK/Ycf46/Vps4 family AAA+-type ATPase
LLDVMTADIHAFKDDIIEGKNAGNVILCKGPPGVGKTLTAEVYSELIERPLYSIHSGNLGTSAAEVEKGLKTAFARTKRWNCVLLLDECDVFVGCRGKSIEQNAIVAEFLRTMEYFDGLLFMTTNRPDDIDDGILARCAAIINYAAPERKDAAAIWRVMSTQFQADLSDGLVEELLNLFPQIVPRDIKMLLRLVIRVAKSQSSPIDLQVFRQCAMFRAIPMAEGSTALAAA